MKKKNQQNRRISFTASFSSKDMYIYNALTDYMQKTGQSTNDYIKQLIKKDLDARDVENTK